MRRKPSSRVEENEVQQELSPHLEEVQQFTQGNQVPIVSVGYDIPELSNKDIRETLLALARAMTTQVSLSIVPRTNIV